MSINLDGFNSLADLIKQLITLSALILGLSITFIKDLLKSNISLISWSLKSSWIIFLLSIIFGIWALMAISGTIFAVTCETGLKGCDPSFVQNYNFPYDTNISRPFLLQVGTFVLATVFLIVFGAQTLRAKSKNDSDIGKDA
jgi:hypothetical protein